MSKTIVKWYGQKVSSKVKGEAAEALLDAAGFILEEANRTIPHEEGTMMRSGKTSVDREKLEAAVSYDTPYAVRQHEDLTLRHDEGRRAKWLEQTVNEQWKRVRDVIRDRIRMAMR